MIVVPESEFRKAVGHKIESNVESVTGVGMIDGKEAVVQRNAAVGIDGAIQPEAEDVLDGLVRRLDFELPEKGLFFFQGSLKTEEGDLQGGGMDLAEVITLDFLAKEGSGLADVGGVGSHAGAHEVVLEPLIGALNLALGLGGEGIDDLDPAVGQDLFPLGIDLIGDLVVIAPDGITALDKAEDGVGINIVGKRQSVFQKDRLKSRDMGPGGLAF